MIAGKLWDTRDVTARVTTLQDLILFRDYIGLRTMILLLLEWPVTTKDNNYFY